MPALATLLAFAETAQRGSFAAAARELGLTASAVAKAVARLEADLGLRLFHRTTRQVSLTGDGEALYARCERVLAELDALQQHAAGTRAEPSGTLRVDAPVVWGRRVVLPAVAALAGRHPRLAVELSFSDRYVDVVKERVDAVVRIGELLDSSLIARRIGWQHLVLVASPGWLQAHGTPASSAALARHAAIVFRNPSTGRQRAWQLRQRGQPLEWLPDSRIVLNDGEAVAEAAAQGLGLAQLPHYMVADAIEARRLVEVLPTLRPQPMPISVVYPSQRQVPPRLAAFVDELARTAARWASLRPGSADR